MLIESNFKYYRRITKGFVTENELNNFLNSSSNFVKIDVEDYFPFGNLGETPNKFLLKYYDSSVPLQPNIDFVKGSRKHIKEKLIEIYKPKHRDEKGYVIGSIFFLNGSDYEVQLNSIKGNGPSCIFHMRVEKNEFIEETTYPQITLNVDAVDIVIEE